MTAEYHLLRRYENSREALREAVQSDPAIRAEAEVELAAAEQIDEGRCVVTKEYAAALREALA